MTIPLRLLLVEDDEDDASLLAGALRRRGFDVAFGRVATARELTAALEAGPWDAVLSDYSLPGYSAEAALAKVRATDPNLPFIVVSGHIGEEAAVALLRAGAQDFVRKDQLARLAPAIEREVREAADRAAGRAAAEALKESEDRYRDLLERMNDVVYEVEFDTSRSVPDIRIVFVSAQVSRIVGYEPREFMEDPSLWPRMIHPDDLAESFRGIRSVTGGESVTRLFRVRHRDTGVYRWVEDRPLPICDETGAVTSVRGILRDVTERLRLEEQLAHQALHDHLTGLPNRTLFSNRVDHALARASRIGVPVSLLFLDLDDFKTVNDGFGHEGGDALLRMVAERLRLAVRPGDTVARFGGDEFAVLIEDARDSGDPATIAERILRLVSEPFPLHGRDVFTGISIGIARSDPAHRVEAADLLRDADIAMYAAKAKGKNQAVAFEPSMHDETLARVTLESDLRRAVREGEFVLRYQPIVELSTGHVAGVEALIRWNHPHRGIVGPGEFIPAAEENGLIGPIGRWVLEEACRQAASWRRESELLSLHVNVSARQLQDPDLTAQVASALRTTGLEPESLVLEITESAVMRGQAEGRRFLNPLLDLGVRIAVDDFGTGYSSLSRLTALPIDQIKIDRAFVAGIAGTPEESAVAIAICRLARTLDLAVVAEGVETAEQAKRLVELGVRLGQGFRFADARPADEIPAIRARGFADMPAERREMRTVLLIEASTERRAALGRAFREAGFRVVEALSGRDGVDAARRLDPDLIALNGSLTDMSSAEARDRLKADPVTASIPLLHLSPDGEADTIGADAFLAGPAREDDVITVARTLLRAS